MVSFKVYATDIDKSRYQCPQYSGPNSGDGVAKHCIVLYWYPFMDVDFELIILS